jgi:hypothetical protein
MLATAYPRFEMENALRMEYRMFSYRHCSLHYLCAGTRLAAFMEPTGQENSLISY